MPATLDGMDVWNTISQGMPSPRKEILLNIDLKPDQVNDDPFANITVYEGIALRSGDMKLLLSVGNSSWYKPPELGGDSLTRKDKVDCSL